MYGQYVDRAKTITKQSATNQDTNETAESATRTYISSWVDYDNITSVYFSLADAATYRVNGASKATPGFDVIDYGQEDCVFENSELDSRHWNKYVLTAFENNYSELANLFNGEVSDNNSSNGLIYLIIVGIIIVIAIIIVCIIIKKKRK